MFRVLRDRSTVATSYGKYGEPKAGNYFNKPLADLGQLYEIRI